MTEKRRSQLGYPGRQLGRKIEKSLHLHPQDTFSPKGSCLKANRQACTAGNVINMLVDVEKRTLGFALDGASFFFQKFGGVIPYLGGSEPY